MENQILDSGLSANPNSDNTKLSDTDREYLNSAGGWAKFLAIMGFIACGFMAIGGIIMLVAMSGLSPIYGGLSPLIALIYFVIAGIYFMPCLYLFNFGSKIQQTCRYEDGFTTSEAFRYLRACFRFMGIMTIVIMGIYLLFILFVMGAGVSRMF